jgi:hypothetical protein
MAKKTAKHNVVITTNPFEPSGSGAPLIAENFWLPHETWEKPLRALLDKLNSGSGRRAIVVIGEYGSGKSYILHWLEKFELPHERRILPYYFENPEIKFYDLANALLRSVGRKHFAKLVFELASTKMKYEQRTLFSTGFDAFLDKYPIKVPPPVLTELRVAIQATGITADEQIADCLARIVGETGRKPYFEYRDFVTTKSGSYVAEKQEPKYFNAILDVLRRGDNVERIAFLLDEFEEVSLQHRLTRKDAQDYIVTLKRLVDSMVAGDFWAVLALTPKAWETTKQLHPPFAERCYEFKVQPFKKSDAATLIAKRFVQVGVDKPPFEAGFLDALRLTTVSSPRRLVKIFHVATNDVMQKGKIVSNARLAEIESELYPGEIAA